MTEKEMERDELLERFGKDLLDKAFRMRNAKREKERAAIGGAQNG